MDVWQPSFQIATLFFWVIFGNSSFGFKGYNLPCLHLTILKRMVKRKLSIVVWKVICVVWQLIVRPLGHIGWDWLNGGITPLTILLSSCLHPRRYRGFHALSIFLMFLVIQKWQLWMRCSKHKRTHCVCWSDTCYGQPTEWRCLLIKEDLNVYFKLVIGFILSSTPSSIIRFG